MQDSSSANFHSTSIDTTDNFLSINARTSLPKNSVILVDSSNLGKGVYSAAKERAQKKSNAYYKGQQVSWAVDNSHFKIYGPGIYLFFEFLKSVTILFGILSILSLVPSIYNYLVGKNFANVNATIQIMYANLSVGALASTTSNPTLSKFINAITDCVCVLSFFFFCLYWDHTSRRKIEQTRAFVLLPSYFTVQVRNFPQQTTQAEIRQTLSHFGTIQQVSAVKNFEECIYYATKIYQLDIQMSQLRHKQQIDQAAISKLQQKRSINVQKLKQQKSKIKDETLKFFCSFEQIDDREKCVQAYKKCQSVCCPDSLAPEMRIGGVYSINVFECSTQPTQILWQNVSVRWRNRWMRYCLQAILILAMLIIAFVLISMLSVSGVPLSNADVDTSSYNSTLILSVTNSTILESWCLKNSQSILSGSSKVLQLCSPYLTQYSIKIAITVGVSLATVIVKLILKQILTSLARFQRYKTYNEEAVNTFKNLFLCYSFTTVLIPIFLQAKIFGITFLDILKPIVKNPTILTNISLVNIYSDFDSGWYSDVGYQLALVWIIMAIWPYLLTPFLSYLSQCYNQWASKRELVQQAMDRRLQPYIFPIEDNYANLLMYIMFGFIFSGGMPQINIIIFFGLLIRYWSHKIQFIRFCKIPRTIDQSLNESCQKMMNLTVLAHFCVSMWIFGNLSIFSLQYSFFANLITTSTVSWSWLLTILSRLTVTWYMTIAFLFCLVCFIIRQTFVRFILGCINKDKSKAPETIKDPSFLGQSIKHHKATTYSYQLAKNPQYSMAMRVINLCQEKDVIISPADSAQIQIENMDQMDSIPDANK